MQVSPKENSLGTIDTTPSLQSLSFEALEDRETTKKCVGPARNHLTATLFSGCILNFMAFLDVNSIKNLGQSNQDWNRVISTKKVVYPGSTKQHPGMYVSLIFFCCVQQLFRHTEKKPMTGRKLLRITKLGKRFNINILSSLEVRHFHRRLKDYHESRKLLEMIHESIARLFEGSLPVLRISKEKSSEMSGEQFIRYSLEQLTLKNVDIDGKPLPRPSPLMRFLSNLPPLDAIGKQLESNGLAQLQAFPALQSLVIEGSPSEREWDSTLPTCRGDCDCRVTDIRHVTFLTELQSLTLHKTDLKDIDLSALKDLKLHSFTLIKCHEITAAGLMQLQHLSVLQSLSIMHCKRMTTAGLAQVESLTALRILNFINPLRVCSGSDKLDDLSKKFLSIQQLAFLCGERSAINDSLVLLNKFFALRSLDLSYSDINDQGFAILANCVALEYLSIDGCMSACGANGITEKGIANLHTLIAPQKRQLQIVSSQYTAREVYDRSNDDEGIDRNGELRYRPDLMSSEEDNDDSVSSVSSVPNDEWFDEGDEGDEFVSNDNGNDGSF